MLKDIKNIDKYLENCSLILKKQTALGKRVAKRWRAEGRGEPQKTKKLLGNGHETGVGIYPESYSPAIVEEWTILCTNDRKIKHRRRL